MPKKYLYRHEVRMTEAEKEDLLDLAKLWGTNRSETLRRAVRRSLQTEQTSRARLTYKWHTSGAGGRDAVLIETRRRDLPSLSVAVAWVEKDKASSLWIPICVAGRYYQTDKRLKGASSLAEAKTCAEVWLTENQDMNITG